MTVDDHGLTVSERERARTHNFLKGRGGRSLPITPLLAARVAIRLRTRWISALSVAAVGIVFFSWSLWQVFGTGAPMVATTSGTIAFLAAYLVLAAALLVTVVQQRVADRRIAAALRQRATRSAALPLRALLGTRFVVACAVMYSSGAAFGAGWLMVAGDPTQRFLATMFSLGVLWFSAVAVAVVADVARRPVIADNEASIRGDALLRVFDASTGAGLYVVMAALVQLTLVQLITVGRSAWEWYPFQLYLLGAVICYAVAQWPPRWVSRGDPAPEVASS